MKRVWWVWMAVMLLGCEKKSSEEANGPRLVEKYCSSCHLPVSPQLLDKKTWLRGVLPAMAGKLGIAVTPTGEYFPDSASALNFEEWLQLVSYFEKTAPDSLAVPAREPLLRDWSIFTLKKPKEVPHTAMTMMVQMHGETMYTSDALTSKLYEWNKNLTINTQISLPYPATQISWQGAEAYVTSIGTMLARDQWLGSLRSIDFRSGKQTVLADSLPRSIYSAAGDFNKDGRSDWLIAGFGHEQGGLYLSTQTASGTFDTKPVWPLPGALQIHVQDFNTDGWPDALVLFAHANEGIWLFLNDKKGGFQPQNILRFSPAYGSTSFQLVDMNQDGLPDLVYTCGDNSDFSKILKPYHGVYVYLNQGNFKFSQAYFYPINGTMKAIAADFDQDGDTDLAAISFFADFHSRPEEGFIYFEQDRPMHFKPHALPIHTEGRWICMDAADYDTDGDLDIILGNFASSFLNIPDYQPVWNKKQPFVVLENRVK